MDQTGSATTETSVDEDQARITATGKVLVDYKQFDYRGFVFCLHDDYGLMLLHCTRKKSKGPHWQVTGGHIDEKEFLDAAKKEDTREKQLLLAGKAGTARELFEETGIDVRSHLERLVPAILRIDAKIDKEGTSVLANEHKHRLFYFLLVTDEDFAKKGVGAMGTDKADCKYRHVKLKLSVEHSGFTFQKDAETAAKMLSLHSGGKVSEALSMARLGMTTKFSNAFNVGATAITEANTEGQEDAAESLSSLTPKRRSKFDKDTTLRDIAPEVLPPHQEKKNMFCCFRTCC